MEISILDVAKFLIDKYNTDGKDITHLKLQKMLYFIEGYYMAQYDKLSLYKENFYAWPYGPVSKEIYDKYKFFRNSSIVLDVDNKKIVFSREISESINNVYKSFGSLAAIDLVRLTHKENSPWYNSKKNSFTPISKKETKKWFEELFLEE